MVQSIHAPVGSPRSRRRRSTKPPEARRREILDAALELFGIAGFEETSVKDVAEAAGVAIGTVYLYFPSKSHLLLAIHEEYHRGLQEEIVRIGQELVARRSRGLSVSFSTAIDEMIDAVIGYCVDNKQACEVITRYPAPSDISSEVRRSGMEFVQFLAAAFEEGIASGSIHVSDPAMAAYLLHTACMHTMGHALTYGDPPDMDRLVVQIRELYKKALAPAPAGLERSGDRSAGATA